MKYSLFGLIVIVLFSFNGIAQGSDKFNQKAEFIRGSLTTSFNKETIEYKFQSIEELNEALEEIIQEFNFNSVENDKTVCELSITLKLEMAVGVETIQLSEVIKTSCANETASQAVKRLKTVLLVACG